ncbi:MAG: N-acetylmuramoyl-L-alanine amidase [Bacteroidales bacterium]|nr:N-acetylmuramoyl-L-alanine amidase [Bacteroidales bacterium]
MHAQTPDQSALRIRTIVIDPGHGGKDAGAPGYDKKLPEKTIVLSIGRKLGKLINETYPDINVVYTRSTDVYIPLIDRAHVANRNNADLFISIHCNSNDSHAPHGASMHVYGSEDKKKNSALFEMSNRICKQENSVILLEDGYSEKYQDFDPNDPSSAILFSLLHNAYYEQSLQFASLAAAGMKGTSIDILGNDGGLFQNNFAVLRLTSTPSVLVECGFVSNKEDFEVLKTDAGQAMVASTLMEAIKAYVAANDSYRASQPVVAAEPAEETAEAPAEEPVVEKPADQPVVAKPVEKPIVEKPVVEKPVVEDKPVIEKPVEKPAVQSVSETVKAVLSSDKAGADTYYGVQVLVSSKIQSKDAKYFAGHEFRYYPAGSVYKYVIGEFSTVDKVREFFKTVQPTFPDSFIVKVENGAISRVN